VTGRPDACRRQGATQYPAADERVSGRRPPAGLDPEVRDWLVAVGRNGGTVSPADVLAVEAFVRGCKADGLWDRLEFVLPLVGQDLAAALVPLRRANSGPPGPVANVNFVPADYDPVLGLKGDGTTKYLDTGYTLARQAGNFHLAAYVVHFPAVPPNGDFTNFTLLGFGASSTGGGYLQVGPSNAGGHTGYQSSTQQTAIAPWAGPFLYSFDNNPSFTSYSGYFSNVNSPCGQQMTGGRLYVLALRVGLGWNPSRVGLVSAGGALSRPQALAYVARMEALARALGRGVVTPVTTDLTHLPVCGGAIATSARNGSAGKNFPAPYGGDRARTFMSILGSTAANRSDLRRLMECYQGAPAFPAQSLCSPLAYRLCQDVPAPFTPVLTVAAPGSLSNSFFDTARGSTLYAALMADVQGCVDLARAAGKSASCPAVIYLPGEKDDQQANAAWDLDCADFLDDLDYDLGKVTGQAPGVRLLYAQLSSWTEPVATGGSGRAYPAVAQLQVDFHVADPARRLLVGPCYQYKYQSGGDPRDVTPQKDDLVSLAESFAKVYKRAVVDGQGWAPLRPTGAALAGAGVVVDFAGATGGLVLDTTTVSDPSGSYAGVDFSGNPRTVVNVNGFEFVDDAGSAYAVSVAVTGPARVTVALSGVPTGANPRLRYAWTGTAGAAPGKATGPRGNLRNQDTYASAYTGLAVPDWCVSFDIPVTA
jgi:hypothetical protein